MQKTDISFLRVAATFAAAGVLFLFCTGFVLDKRISVPDITGLTVSQASSTLQSQGLTLQAFS